MNRDLHYWGQEMMKVGETRKKKDVIGHKKKLVQDEGFEFSEPSLKSLSLMQSAYILFTIEPGNVSSVIKRLRDLHEVKESYYLYGTYDIICKIEDLTIENLKDVISKKIRRIYGVNSTMTLMVT